MSIKCAFYDPQDGIVFMRIPADGSFFSVSITYLHVSCKNSGDAKPTGHDEVAYLSNVESPSENPSEFRQQIRPLSAAEILESELAAKLTYLREGDSNDCVVGGSKVDYKQKSWEFPIEGQGPFGEYGAKNGLGEECWLFFTYILRGEQPSRQILSAELGTDLLRAICWNESTFRQFDSSGRPLINYNGNGTLDIGCMQINGGSKSEAWNWRMNVARGREILADKRVQAKVYLDQHGSYTDEMLENETIQRYNGGRYHQWDSKKKMWVAVPPSVYVAMVDAR
jgi:hypothetical protein